MPKEEWGVKRACPKCSTRFYDLQNDPLTCPACEHEFTLESLTGTKSRTMQADKPDAQSAKKEAASEDEDVILDDDAEEEEDSDIEVDDSLLEDDDDDDTVSLDEIADVSSEDNED